MNTEIRNCQNCHKDFEIDAQDFQFYKKVSVPPPTFCPSCRFQRRTMFRNERVLYRRNCGLCGKSFVTIFAPDKPYTVYCNPCWWSDKWDPGSYSREYDPNRNFFEQFKELADVVPRSALIVDYPSLVNSDYTNHVGHCKNSYLVFDTDYAENVLYATIANACKDSMDLKLVEKSERCYEDINCVKCFNTFFSEDCNDCQDVYFSKNCSGCGDCVGCVNLRNKKYHIFNQPYSAEDYRQEVDRLQFDSFGFLRSFQKKVREFWIRYPQKYMHGTHNTNVSGDYVYESKNGKALYQCRGVEDGGYCQRVSVKPAKDVYDYTEWGYGAARIYECITVGEQVDIIKFSVFCIKNSMNVEYSIGVVSCSYAFGCTSLRNKKFCILNKEYPEAEYRKLREQIIRDMNARPYVDEKGRIFAYGEFFPYDLSFFDYNESTAPQYFPLDKSAVLEKGWRWRDVSPSEYVVTKKGVDLPDRIGEVPDSITDEVIGCETCNRAFRIVPMELKLLRQFKFPLPRSCSECRHMERMRRLNLPFLWNRVCAKCRKAVRTAYTPDQSEIIYCEQCYQAEVV